MSALPLLAKIIGWPISIFFLFIGAVGFLMGDTLAGPGCALIGLSFLPAFRRVKNFTVTPWMRTAGVTVGFIFLVMGVPKTDTQMDIPDLSAAIDVSSYGSSRSSAVSVSSVLQERQQAQSAPASSPDKHIALVTAITDGDTIKVRLSDGSADTVRLLGIDAPEKSPAECFNGEAAAHMRTLVANKEVDLSRDPTEDRDVYGRLLRYVEVNGIDVSAAMIRDGYAHSYRKYPHPRLASYNALEGEARTNKRGLWGDICSKIPKSTPKTAQSSSAAAAAVSIPVPAPIPVKKDTPAPPPFAEQPPPPSEQECVIKGNVNSEGELIYHFPGCASYNVTKIKPEEGDAWFCTEAEASAAGFRRALNCP